MGLDVNSGYDSREWKRVDGTIESGDTEVNTDKIPFLEKPDFVLDFRTGQNLANKKIKQQRKSTEDQNPQFSAATNDTAKLVPPPNVIMANFGGSVGEEKQRPGQVFNFKAA